MTRRSREERDAVFKATVVVQKLGEDRYVIVKHRFDRPGQRLSGQEVEDLQAMYRGKVLVLGAAEG